MSIALVVKSLGRDTRNMDRSDTTALAHRAQLEAYRRLTARRRLEIALELSDEVRAVSIAGIKNRHPEYTDEQAAQALCRVLLGDSACQAAWPDRPLMAP